MKGQKRKREVTEKNDSENVQKLDTEKNAEKETNPTEDDSQKIQLMNMFSQATLTNYQRQFRPAEPQHSTKKENIGETEGEKDENANEEVPATDSEEVNEPSEDPNKDDRTLFVGNLPISMDQKAIMKLFKEYGTIESVRFRSIPVAGMKVDKAGDQNLVKKVSAVKHTFGDQKASFNAYVVFVEAASVTRALVENNKVIDGRHIRVDRVTPSLFDPHRTLFLGNLPHRVDEEEVREHFAKVLPYGHDDIESIRIIRDPETLIGKGIGYLLLKNRQCLLEALSLHDKDFKPKWKLRVTMCSKKKSTSSSKGTNARNNHSSSRSSNSSSNEEDRPRKKAKTEKEVTMKNALKRLNLKSVKTKKKLMEERKSKKSTSQKRPPPPPRRPRSNGAGGKKPHGEGKPRK